MHYLFVTSGQLLVVFILVVLTQADYEIDDSNKAIQYSPSGSWIPIVGANGDQIDPSRVFDNTVTFSDCRTENNCSAVIPFYGTGIQVYNVIRAQLNVTFAVDEDTPSSYIYSDSLCFTDGSPTTTPQGCYNMSVYKSPTLNYTSHKLTMAMLSFTGSNSIYGGNISDFFFDYAVVYSPASTPPSSEVTSSTESPSSTQSSTSQSQRSHKSPAAAIGGAVGGIATLSAVVFAVIYCRKRNRKQANDISDSPMLLTSPMASDAPVTAQTPTTPSTFRPPAEVEAARASANLVGVIPTSTDDTELTAHLTQEQSELVQGLIKHNVPLPAVVGALEGILRGDRNSGGGEGSGSQLTQSDWRVEAEKPPVYDFT